MNGFREIRSYFGFRATWTRAKVRRYFSWPDGRPARKEKESSLVLSPANRERVLKEGESSSLVACIALRSPVLTSKEGESTGERSAI